MTSGGHKYILTVICLFSRYVTAVPLRSKKAKDVSEALFNHVFARHGRPDRIHSDEGKEFINAGLKRLYRNWNIRAVTTGGYRPWSNPVERYHRFMNSSMTMLSGRYGEDWVSYLQAVVFCYNASNCDSTGHSPYYIAHGRDADLLEHVGARPLPDGDKVEDMADISSRLEKAYAQVLEQQSRMAEANLARRKGGRPSAVYAKGDSVLYWEPAQSKVLKSAPDCDTVMAKKAPGKWKPRWTGPHVINSVRMGKYGPRYSFRHDRRKITIENVKTDKLTGYTPWSTSIASTSRDLDGTEAPFVVGAWCHDGDHFIVPTSKPYPFGLGKVLEARDDGTIHFQWYSGERYAATRPFKPMWWNAATKSSYVAMAKRRAVDVPFTGVLDGMKVTQSDIAMHGFTLKPGGCLRAVLLAECSRNADIWWTQRLQ